VTAGIYLLEQEEARDVHPQCVAKEPAARERAIRVRQQDEFLIILVDAVPPQAREVAAVVQTPNALVDDRIHRCAQIDLIEVVRLATLELQRDTDAIVDLHRESHRTTAELLLGLTRGLVDHIRATDRCRAGDCERCTKKSGPDALSTHVVLSVGA
jgi:hypothetical protein